MPQQYESCILKAEGDTLIRLGGNPKTKFVTCYGGKRVTLKEHIKNCRREGHEPKQISEAEAVAELL